MYIVTSITSSTRLCLIYFNFTLCHLEFDTMFTFAAGDLFGLLRTTVYCLLEEPL